MFLGADTETFPIKHRQIAPKLVCLTVYDGHQGILVGNGDPYQADAVEEVLKAESVWHNASYDMAVIAHAYPHLIPLLCRALSEGRIHDTKMREKLRVLADHGNLRIRQVSEDHAVPILYDLSSLCWRYLKKDRAGQKGGEREKLAALHDEDEDTEGRGDLWRYNYDALDGWRAEEYPADAAAYAIEDSEDVYRIFPLQDHELQACYAEVGRQWDPRIESLHVASDVFLYYSSALGVHINLEEVQKLKAEVESDLSEDKLSLLIASGVMRPAEPSRPWRKRHSKDCPPKARKNGCSCLVEWTQPKPSSIDTKVLQGLVEQTCKVNQIPVRLTETGRISVASEVLEDVADLHPVLAQYKYRQSKIKVLQVEIPRMSASVIHPHYDGLKSTGRTSCAASKLYPSGNIQNVDPRARRCYIPPTTEEWIHYLVTLGVPVDEAVEIAADYEILMCSVDYGGMELVTLAQVVYSRFGYSSHRELLLQGVDLHAYLGCQIAKALDSDFRDYLRECGAQDRMAEYRLFKALGDSPDGSPERAFYDEFRTFAKPTGLGYPGGLGPDTFVVFARGGYGLKITRDVAVLLRDVWHDTHPDMKDHFNEFQNFQQDNVNSCYVTDKQTGHRYFKQKFWYSSLLGMVRRGCSYTEGINGLGLQNPGAELAKMGLCGVARASYDRSQGSVLFGRNRIAGFIHDEILSYVLRDGRETEVAQEKARLMVEGAAVVCPDVPIKAEPCFMYVWDKKAKPVWDGDRLIPWAKKEVVTK